MSARSTEIGETVMLTAGNEIAEVPVDSIDALSLRSRKQR
jgi:hypothetical protein